MQTADVVQIRELDSRDINAVLARNVVGRVAFTRGERIDVIPLHYAYSDGCVYGRTTTGGKLAALHTSGSHVAFEVDEVRSMYNWRSILIHGTFEVLSAETGEDEWQAALAAIRRLDRTALQKDDHAPDRTEVFRITVEDVTGRALG